MPPPLPVMGWPAACVYPCVHVCMCVRVCMWVWVSRVRPGEPGPFADLFCMFRRSQRRRTDLTGNVSPPGRRTRLCPPGAKRPSLLALSRV